MNKEIEIKAKVSSLKAVEEKLKKLGAKKQGQKKIVDYFFTPNKGEKFYGKNCRVKLRLRQENDSKNCRFEVHENVNSITANEYEVESGDLKTLRQALKLINLQELLKVEKVRTKYKKGRINIDLDKVKGLGSFMEVEVMDLPYRQALKTIKDFFQKLGVDEKNFVYTSYLDLLLVKVKKQ